MNQKLRSFAYLTSLVVLMLSIVFAECAAERGINEALSLLPVYILLGLVLTAIAGLLAYCDIVPCWAKQTNTQFKQSVGE